MASSGDNKYLPTITKVSKNSISPNLMRPPKSSTKTVYDYALWNQHYAKVSIPSGAASKERVDAYKNIIAQEHIDLEIIVYQKIYNYSGITDKTLFDLIESRLLKEISGERINNGEARFILIAWQAKALASSADPKFIKHFDDLLSNEYVVADAWKLKKHLKDARSDVVTRLERNAVLKDADSRANRSTFQNIRWLKLFKSRYPKMQNMQFNKLTTLIYTLQS